MEFTSRHIRGAGRGKGLGTPTINLEIPNPFDLDTGIYAVYIAIGINKYSGAMHYGPIPTFGDETLNLEVHILNNAFPSSSELMTDTIIVTVVKKLREVLVFDNLADLQKQMKFDIDLARKILS
jgi:riboflavin kinase/FMN adenylyltransferase